MAKSNISGFYSLSVTERLESIKNATTLDQNDIRILARQDKTLGMELVDIWIENAVSIFGLPFGVATNLVVNGREVLVPMVVEESSVLAAASFAAKLARKAGGFQSQVLGNEMIGQIHYPRLTDKVQFLKDIDQHKEYFLERGRSITPRLIMRGGGLKDLYTRILEDGSVVLHLIVDPCDAMGANIVNTLCEFMALEIENKLGIGAGLKILSNLADRRLVRTECKIFIKDLVSTKFSGIELAERIVDASNFAYYDPYRACTHNKGIMNGIDPVVIATGNDWRAVEAGAHAFAVKSGQYRGLSKWKIEGEYIIGEMTMPMCLGIVGGVTRQHPLAELSLRLMEVKSVRDLSEIIVSVGLAQNFSALRALAAEGIQDGHMRLHAKNIALNVGAEPHEVIMLSKKFENLMGRDFGKSDAKDLVKTWLTELRN